MKILYVINGLGFSLNTGIGGSDKRAVETIRGMQKTAPDDTYGILTTDTGFNLFKDKEHLETTYHVINEPKWWPKYFKNSILGRSLSYVYALLKSIKFINEFNDYDMCFATSDFIYDLIPAIIYKKQFGNKLVSMIHHRIKSPFRRNGNFLINCIMYISQNIGILLIKKYSNKIFLYDTPEGKLIAKNFLKNDERAVFVKNGVDTSLIDSARQGPKQYEACFLGGIRQSKGIDEFVPIWKKVVAKNHHAKYLIIGGGSKNHVDNLKRRVKLNNLENNIIFSGPLSGKELYESIKSAYLFVFPSHEEGWGISVCEAMYCGLPIICYDLPAYNVFGKVLDKVPIGDIDALVYNIHRYLDDVNHINNKYQHLKTTASKFSWENISSEEHNILKTVVK